MAAGGYGGGGYGGMGGGAGVRSGGGGSRVAFSGVPSSQSQEALLGFFSHYGAVTEIQLSREGGVFAGTWAVGSKRGRYRACSAGCGVIAVGLWEDAVGGSGGGPLHPGTVPVVLQPIICRFWLKGVVVCVCMCVCV